MEQNVPSSPGTSLPADRANGAQRPREPVVTPRPAKEQQKGRGNDRPARKGVKAPPPGLDDVEQRMH